MTKKFKCLNPECKHTWTAEDFPNTCPNCQGNEIKEAKQLPKWAYGAGIGLFVLFFLLRFCSGGSDATTVRVDFDDYTGQLEVSLSGNEVMNSQHKCNYRIGIERNGAPFGNPVKKDVLKRKFDNPGSYTVNVTWIGKSKMPPLKWSGSKTFFVQEKPQAPFILGVHVMERDVNKKCYTVKIQCDTSIVASHNTEYSQDGNQYKAQPVFNNLKPGDYVFYARNTLDPELVVSYNKTLPNIQKESLSDSKINQLLKAIANGDEAAYKDFVNKVENGKSIPVTGNSNIKNSSALIDYVLTTQEYRSVRTQRDADNQIVKIIL